MKLKAKLPTTETLQPTDAAGVAAAIRAAGEQRTAVYPVGGGTSLELGLEARQAGVALSLAGLDRLVDYPARDMTITVEAGTTLARLAETLAAERQWLPIDAPQPERATAGGLVATGWNGPRRFGWASLRDYVIGIAAVDGRGIEFRGGGRVVKNVAGYDFCKLLTGSLGTLAVITQLTFKVRPLPEASALVAAEFADLAMVERQLAALGRSRVTPAAIELVAGPPWADDPTLGVAATDAWRLITGLEGTAAEVDWLVDRWTTELRQTGGLAREPRLVSGAAAAELWRRLRDFSVADAAPLLLQAVVRPSSVGAFLELVRACDARAAIQAHAGNGVVIVRLSQFDAAATTRWLVGKLHPAAVAAGGHLTVLASNGLGELTRQAVWGGVQPATHWMDRVKRQFDPLGILNPGRFIYSS